MPTLHIPQQQHTLVPGRKTLTRASSGILQNILRIHSCSDASVAVTVRVALCPLPEGSYLGQYPPRESVHPSPLAFDIQWLSGRGLPLLFIPLSRPNFAFCLILIPNL